ncbi:MAG: cobyrinate a,c-diamide synthase [Magnetococcales bacterium]|nr:cobyrinate a,c-diamide synthase [Magnetococcales bacterium]
MCNRILFFTLPGSWKAMLCTTPRLFIAAPRKSSGKTLVSVGLSAAFRRRGLAVQPFKKGLDFIDPQWLGQAAGRACRNLDPFVMGREETVRRLVRFGGDADLCLMEGNMGFFDGPTADGSDCGAAMAAWLGSPTLLVVDCSGMARSLAALVKGFMVFPGGESIQGVILNRITSARQEGKIRQAIDDYCGLPILGILPRDAAVSIEERHLGLVTAREGDAASPVEAMGRLLENHADLDGILNLARKATPLQAEWVEPVAAAPKVRVALGLDEAFHFYYPDNLEALRAAGVELLPFRMLDGVLPEADGLMLGGGFPEVFMEQLSGQREMFAEIRRRVGQGWPVYAECGGLMALGERLRWGKREEAMAGVLPLSVAMHPRPQGYGYMILESTGRTGWPGAPVRCHEFHHSQVIELREEGVEYAYRLKKGTGLGQGRDGLLYRKVLASYAHIHAAGAPGWAEWLAGWFA